MAVSLKKEKQIVNFSAKHSEMFPIIQPEKKYPKTLAVFQNIFWKLTHEKPLRDDLLKLLFFFSPKIRQIDSDQLSERSVFTITAKEYAELTGIKSSSAYTTLNRAVDILYEHSVRFVNESSEEIIRTRLISSCIYKEGVFSVSFTHYALYIMSVFNESNPFTQIKIESVMPLSGYSLKIYPLFAQNKFRQQPFEVPLNDLKMALNIDPNSYSDYREFKKKVLKPSIDTINLKTEFFITFKAVKKGGKKADHVQFCITETKSESESKPKSKPKTKPKESQPEQEAAQQVDPSEPKTFTPRKLVSLLVRKGAIERFKESDESPDDFIARLTHDFQNGLENHWHNKLQDAGLLSE